MAKKLVGIIGGQGKMGKYFADFFAKNDCEVMISDVGTKLTNLELAKKADVVVVSVPIDSTREVIAQIAPHMKKSSLLMDLTSVKAEPMEEMKKAKSDYLGCHPLFGPTASLRGQIAILCPGRGKLWHYWFSSMLEKNGVIVRELTAKKHDELMSYIQTLTHFSHIAFADALRKSGIPIKEFIKYPSPVYMLELYMMGRILNQDPKLYANIQISNKMNLKAVESYLKSCRELGETIEKRKFSDNVKFFKKNTEYLNHFAKIAMDESDRLLRHLKLPHESRLFKTEAKPKKSDIAILGPQNTYSELALKKHDPKASPWYAMTISDVFHLVESGKVKSGLVPIENSTSGSVRTTMDELYESDVHIAEVLPLPINLALASTVDCPLKKLTTIYSHTQPLLQARQFLKKSCPGATLIPMNSTTAALERMLSEDKRGTAVIVSPMAVSDYHLKIIKDSIQDDKENTTHFALIKKGAMPQSAGSGKKTSIAFHFKKDSPGSLNAVLQTFASEGINLTKIESRPSAKTRGDYVFYIDFEGSATESSASRVLSGIKKTVAHLKVLGSY